MYTRFNNKNSEVIGQRMEPIKLESISVQHINLVSINNKEFITATTEPQSKDALTGIIAYNIVSNAWRVLIPYPSDFSIKPEYISYDPIAKNICIYGYDENVSQTYNLSRPSVLAIFNVDTNKCSIITNETVFNPGTILLNIAGKYHLFAGFANHDHLMYDEKNKKFETVFTFPGLVFGLDVPCVVYSKKRDSVYLFGGRDWGALDSLKETVWKCKIERHEEKKCEWSEWKIKNIQTKYNVPCILTPDEKYIIVFMENNVILMDLEREEITELEQKFPDEFNPRFAVLCNGKPDDGLVVGYIREITKEIDVIVPNELMDLVMEYCRWMNVHFIMKLQGGHYMIQLHDILKFYKQ